VLVSATARTPFCSDRVDLGLDLVLGHGLAFHRRHAIHRREQLVDSLLALHGLAQELCDRLRGQKPGLPRSARKFIGQIDFQWVKGTHPFSLAPPWDQCNFSLPRALIEE